MPTAIYTRALLGLEAPRVTVETHIYSGVPGTTLVGLPETAVREARDRVRSAIINCGFRYPEGRVTVNLAPADLVKQGSRFDLAIALSILHAAGKVSGNLAGFEFVAELGLFGELRRVSGSLCAALATGRADPPSCLVTAPDPALALVPTGVLQASHLAELVEQINGKSGSGLATLSEAAPHKTTPDDARHGAQGRNQAPAHQVPTVVGQQAAKRGLTIAAAGRHHLLMVGPPGTGKTLLARSLPALLPPLSVDEQLETAAIYSAAGLPWTASTQRPFRDPHHSATAPALVGGGATPTPGEVTLAHNGVLFLDELPHFAPAVLNLLREPIESGTAVVARAGYRVRYPCRFQLIAAMNPCPAGRTCREDTCRCTPAQVQRYQTRISGPMLDRIDLQVHVGELSADTLTQALQQPDAAAKNDPAASRERVYQAHTLQHERQGCLNAELPAEALARFARPDAAAGQLLARAQRRYQLTARSYHKVLRVARTIADLNGTEKVDRNHIAEALGCRSLEWQTPQ